MDDSLFDFQWRSSLCRWLNTWFWHFWRWSWWYHFTDWWQHWSSSFPFKVSATVNGSAVCQRQCFHHGDSSAPPSNYQVLDIRNCSLASCCNLPMSRLNVGDGFEKKEPLRVSLQMWTCTGMPSQCLCDRAKPLHSINDQPKGPAPPSGLDPIPKGIKRNE